MTTISSLPAAGLRPSSSSGAPASREDAAAAAVAPVAMPSSIVTLSPASVAAATQDGQGVEAAAGSPLLWESPVRDKITSLVARNFFAPSVAGRFHGLGSAMLEQFQRDGADQSQSVRQLPAGIQLYSSTPVLTMSKPVLHGQGDNQVSLTISTKRGAEVKLMLDSTEDGLGVQLKTSGTLSEAERGAVAKLATAFQEAIDGMAHEPPQLKLGGLMQFDPSLLASVDLHTVVKSPADPDSTQTLDLHADATQRKVSLSGASGKMEVSVDLSQLAGLGTKAQQAKAVASYLNQFDLAATRGHGDAALVTLFKDTFAELNGNNDAASLLAASGDQPARLTLSGEDHALLTGLADFDATITQAAKAINPMRPNEKDAFSYRASQSTSINGHYQGDRSITQHQKLQLTASYHMPAVAGAQLRLDGGPEDQNYSYYQIEDSASSDALMAYEQGRLTKASLRQSATQSSREMKYAFGHLKSDFTTPGHSALQRDLVAALAPDLKGERHRSLDEIYQRQQALREVSDLVPLQAYPDGGEN
ncbi:MAG TPA: hypothetical protein VFS95_12630 [Telluria sp.]|nr:hypothetical protein [Telluria sp.]